MELSEIVKGAFEKVFRVRTSGSCGYVFPVPLFINEGDVIRFNTETGEYNDRTVICQSILMPGRLFRERAVSARSDGRGRDAGSAAVRVSSTIGIAEIAF